MDKVTLNNKEQKRLIVLNEVQAGRLTGIEAATMLGLSLRQTRRLLAMYRQAGRRGWIKKCAHTGSRHELAVIQRGDERVRQKAVEARGRELETAVAQLTQDSL